MEYVTRIHTKSGITWTSRTHDEPDTEMEHFAQTINDVQLGKYSSKPIEFNCVDGRVIYIMSHSIEAIWEEVWEG